MVEPEQGATPNDRADRSSAVEDKEFELARQFVRFAATAAQCAYTAPLPAIAAARNAAAAARLYAPGLLPRLRGWSSRA